MAKLTWSDPALRQLEEIIEFIALDKPDAASRVAKHIFDATDNVERFRLLGRSIPEFPVPGYRQLWIRPCWIYYRVIGDEVCILHVRRAESPFRIEFIDEK
jgi:plasmid stabilization system protein ParE